MIKAEKIVLIIAGLSLVFFIVSSFFPSPKQGSTLEILLLIPTIPIIIGAIILVRNRSNLGVSPILRIIGFIIFIL